MSRKVLIFSVVWPPTHSPGARRMVSFARYLVRTGHEVHVVTSAVQDSLYGGGDTVPAVDGVRLHLVRDPVPKGAIRKSLGKRSSLKATLIAIKERIGLDKDLPMGLKMFAFFWRNRLELKSDWVIGSFPNIVNVVVAAAAARASNARLWADFRDAWTRDADYRWNLFAPLSGFIERRIVGHAELLTFVSGGVLGQLAGHAGRAGESILVRNGADALTPVGYVADSGRIFGYWGSLHGARRDPRPLFAALAEANSGGGQQTWLEVFTGDDPREIERIAAECDCLRYVRVREPVDIADFAEHASRWIAGLVITRCDPRAKGELTTKLFDYVGACLPVVAIAPGGFEIRDVVASIPHSASFAPEETAALAAHLRDAVGRRVEPDAARIFTRDEIVARALAGRFGQ